MRSVPSLLTMLGDQGSPRHVMMPWHYVQLRRRAAGLTIAQVAKPFWTRPEHQHDVERHFRNLEAENVRHQRLYITAGKPYFFSIDVYHQLANLPPHQHPRLCTRCAWDEHANQYDHNGGDTTWAADDSGICTRCEQEIAWEAGRATAKADRRAA
ncbi:hypothetical protein KRZ98_13350 [Sphingobium sp. AS12]|uniref:hypothetical protein n=1 Tax=Sphingobium sp. AS12 TaxID=2849495 RepID=UPI001C316B59|nr:hypothetical protein [Sphingobium sp. AS12]MBV2149257.1 hypothetical protein [Sphingobium sp. AS12]